MSKIVKRMFSFYQRDMHYISSGKSINNYLNNLVNANYFKKENTYVITIKTLKNDKNISNNMKFNKDTSYQVSIKTLKKNDMNTNNDIKLSCADVHSIKHAYCGCVEYDEQNNRFFYK